VRNENPTLARQVLTPDALEMLQAISRCGSFAAAARELGVVPSALTYRVRQVEEALDVLLFDRSSRQARLTAAGQEMIREGGRLLEEIDAVANRVRRVATGWEPRFTVAVDSIIDHAAVFDLCEAFFALDPPTQLHIRTETLSGTEAALSSGQADLALGVAPELMKAEGLQFRPLGSQRFVFAVAPHHPLARAEEPLPDALVRRHRVVAVADSALQGRGATYGLLSGQALLTVSTMEEKLAAQLRGLGCGTLPEGMVRRHVAAGRLVVRQLERPDMVVRVAYAWRKTPVAVRGRALDWWQEQLEQPRTREALMGAL
jgi:molybdate transport repressor ModE-like protein